MDADAPYIRYGQGVDYSNLVADGDTELLQACKWLMSEVVDSNSEKGWVSVELPKWREFEEAVNRASNSSECTSDMKGERRWNDGEAHGVYQDGRLSIFATPSMGPNADGVVAVGIEAPWIRELWTTIHAERQDAEHHYAEWKRLNAAVFDAIACLRLSDGSDEHEHIALSGVRKALYPLLAVLS